MRHCDESGKNSVEQLRAMTWIENLRSTDWSLAAVAGFCSYSLGCFTAGYYLVRFRTGTDVREIGSGSVGAKNVGRVLGKPGFLFTLLFDFGKGALAVAGVRQFTSDDRLVVLAMMAVVIGHIWPVQLRFRGGKGMATMLGGLLIYDLRLFFASAVAFLCLFVVTRKTVLPGLFALACAPLASLLLDHDTAKAIQLSVLAGLVLVAHRKNLSEEILQLVPRRHAESKPDHL